MPTFDLTAEILHRLTTSPVTADRVIAARYVGATSTSGELVDACRVSLARDTSPEVRAAMEFSIPPANSTVTESAPVVDVQADEPTVTERPVVDACIDAPPIIEDAVQSMMDSLP